MTSSPGCLPTSTPDGPHSSLDPSLDTAGMSSVNGVQPVAVVPPPSTAGPSSYSFVTGILVGQGSILIFIALFIRYVVFEDGASSNDRTRSEHKKVSFRTRFRVMEERCRRESGRADRPRPLPLSGCLSPVWSFFSAPGIPAAIAHGHCPTGANIVSRAAVQDWL